MKKSLLKISQQTSWQILGKIVTSLSTFIVLATVTRLYGTDGTGIFTLAITYLGIFYLFSDFGFNAYVLGKIHHHEQDLQSQWSKLLGTRVLWSLLLIIIALGALPFLPFVTPLFFYIVLFGSMDILASAIFVTNNLVFQSKLRYDLMVIATIIGTVFGLVVFLYSANSKFPIFLVTFSYLMGGMMIALTSLYLVVRVITKFRIEFDRAYIKNIFMKSWPLTITLALNVIYFRADSFILASFKGISDTGIYNVAYQIFQNALVLPTFIMNSFYPMMLESLKNKIGRFAYQIKLVSLGLFIISILLLAITYYLSPLIISVITGGLGFTGSIESLKILSLGFPAYFLSSLLMWVMVAKGMYKKMALIYTFGLIFNFSANLYFIPQYSYIASSWITGISEYLILGMQVMVIWRNR